jgi:anti-sigma regulatory factor (Ser/Thr protein kinase)
MGVVALPHAPASATTARRRIVAELTELGLPAPVVADAELVIAEMVGNAVRHARPLSDGTLSAGWEVADRTLVLRVTDGGAPTRPVRRSPTEVLEAENGRGLAIVAAIARDWGAEEDGRGLRTWATIDLVAAAGR